MKYSENEKNIQRLRKLGLVYEMCDEIMIATENDNTATALAKKVTKNDIESLLEKIQSLFQRSDANFKDITNKSDIRVLIDWLEYICED